MADKLDNSAPIDDGQGTRMARQPTGAGAEAAEGIHGKPEERGARRDPSDRTSLEDRDAREPERRGSEPLESSSQEHQSGYGGRGGSPRQSNDGTDGE